MTFSIRDLLLVTVIAALAAGWWVDRSRQGAEIERLQRMLATRQLAVPGSPEAMAAFYSEVKNGRSGDLTAATRLCFILGNPAAPYMPLLGKADKTCVPDDPRFPAGVQYEFWCGRFSPREYGGSLVSVVATGSPLRIVAAEVVIIAPPEELP